MAPFVVRRVGRNKFALVDVRTERTVGTASSRWRAFAIAARMWYARSAVNREDGTTDG